MPLPSPAPRAPAPRRRRAPALPRALALALTLALTPACAARVTVDGAGGAAPSTTGAGGAGGAGGATAAGGSGGAAPACVATRDAAAITLSTFDGLAYGCALGEAGAASDVVVLGALREVGDDHLVVDGCPPGASCPPLLSRLDVVAPDLAMRAPVGAFVEARVRVALAPCRARVVVRTIAEWAGATSPAGPAERLVVAATEGALAPLEGAPFVVDLASACEGAPIEARALRFRWPDGGSVVAPMGATVTWTLDGSGRRLRARNLRAYAGADDVAYWLAEE